MNIVMSIYIYSIKPLYNINTIEVKPSINIFRGLVLYLY